MGVQLSQDQPAHPTQVQALRCQTAAGSMTETAYVVGTLDIRQDPPCLAAVAIYSSRAMQLTQLFEVEYVFDMFSVQGATFGEALDRAEELLRHDAWAWRIYEAPFLRREHERRK